MAVLKKEQKLKPILLRDQEAISLIHKRAAKEERSLANALVFTVKQALRNYSKGIDETHQEQ